MSLTAFKTIQLMKNVAIILFISILYGYISTKVALNLKEDNNRLMSNQEVLFSKAQSYKVSDSLNAIKIQALQLELSDVKAHYTKETELLKKAQVEVSTLQQLALAQTKSLNQIKLKLRDSIRVDTVMLRLDTIPCFTYSSKWLDAQGCIFRDSIDLQIKNRESLILATSLRKKKFLFFKLPVWLFGYKQEDIDIISENPNTIITGIKYIKLVK